MTDETGALKRCAKCGEQKPVTLFSKNKQHRDGFQTRCKACVRIENQSYREKNGDVWRERQRERYYADIEKTRREDREYYHENHERILKRRRNYYEENAEKLRQQLRDNRAANVEATRAKHEAYRTANAHVTEKYCPTCNEVKPLSRFSKNESQKDGYRLYCKTCINFMNRTSWAESIRRRNKAYRGANVDTLRAYRDTYRKNNPDVHRASNQRRRERVKANGGIFLTVELIAMRIAQNGFCAYCQYQYHTLSLTIDHVIPILQGGRHEAANIVLACRDCNSQKNARTPEQWVDRWYLRFI
jgi:5-methylcytosine-specific restriction endonuclease McrA